MATPVFEEFDPASDCDCPGCVHWRRVLPASPSGRHPAAHRAVILATASSTALAAGEAAPAFAAPHTPDRPDVPAADEPDTPQGPTAPLHGAGGKPAKPPAPLKAPSTTRADIIKRARTWVAAKAGLVGGTTGAKPDRADHPAKRDLARPDSARPGSVAPGSARPGSVTPGSANPDPANPDPANPGAPTGTPTPYPGAAYFGPGATNEYVTRLGRMLVERGAGPYYASGPGPRWSDADRRATRAFQQAQGWRGRDADGLPGPRTWALLVTGQGRDITAGAATPSAPASHGVPGYPGRALFRPGADNKYVTQLGRQLMRTGYGTYYTTGPGPRWGEADRRGVEAFQRAQGWRGGAADGYPGPETWRRLFS